MVDQQRRRTVLVVEDDQVARFWIRSVLESHFACKVAETDRGANALELVRAERPDVLVLDLLMPEINGCETLRAIRQDPDHGKLPVVVVSILDADHDLVKEARRLGVAAVLQKPVQNLDLVAELAGVMARPA
jgi:CheY-like chemotaxis protein